MSTSSYDPYSETVTVMGHTFRKDEIRTPGSDDNDARFRAAETAREIGEVQHQQLGRYGVGGHQASQQLQESRGYGPTNTNSGWTGNFQPGEIDQSALYVERQPDPVLQVQLDRFRQLRDMLPGRLG